MAVLKGHKGKKKHLWKTSVKWRDVTPLEAPEILLGSDEGGFMSLEEVDGDVYFPGMEGGEGVEAEGRNLANKKKKDKIGKAEQLKDKISTVGSVSDIDDSEEKSKKHKKKRKLGADSLEIGDIDGDDAQPQEVMSGKGVNEKKKAKKQKVLEQNVKAKAKLGVLEKSTPEDRVKDASGQAILTNAAEQKKKKKQKKTKKKKDSKQKLSDGVPGENVDTESVSEADRIDNEDVDMTAWNELRLHPLLMKALAELGFTEPSAIQKACIPVAAHQGKDLVGAAETGSGKTLAFGLPILQRLLDEREKELRRKGDVSLSELPDQEERGLRALIVAPTRELALQVCDHIRAAAKYTGMYVVPIVGGIASQKQQRLLKKGPEIVVGTPGRLWELMSTGESHLIKLNMLSFFVLDEADRMVEKGHFSELQSIIDLLPRRDAVYSSQPPPSVEADAPELLEEYGQGEDGSEQPIEGERQPNVPLKKRQTMVFSATLAVPANFHQKLKWGNDRRRTRHESPDSVAALIERVGMSTKAAIVDLTPTQVVAGKLEESAIECVEEEKDVVMYYALRLHGSGRTLVFCTSIAAVRRVAAILQLLGLPALALHAQMQQRQRLKALERYKASEDGILVATDVAARGLDIPGIRTVLHFQLPHSAEVYVHRCGRTARAGEDGCSVALISPKDRVKYLALLRALSKGQSLRKFPVDASFLPQIRKCVQTARKLDEKLRRASQSQAEQTWIARHAEMLGVDQGSMEDGTKRKRPKMEEDEGQSNSSGGSRRETAEIQNMRRELQRLLLETLKPRAFSRSYFSGKGVSPLVAEQVLQHKGPQKQKVSQKKGGKHNKGVSVNAGQSRFAVIGHEKIDSVAALRKAVSGKR